ncbi:hypothetical protein PR048_013847 [Dryococelus australis]|uniref:Uncharacterized protein n=1 Tax=Dryococelus australis TaxID=614101 RepID=A0ABQ9HTK7_9NEOP|nr:hypothetical protein PR048_013847 [Dryococelus australis]
MKGRKETGDSREYSPTNGVVRHDSHVRKSRVHRQGIEPGSPRWEAIRSKFTGHAASSDGEFNKHFPSSMTHHQPPRGKSEVSVHCSQLVLSDSVGTGSAPHPRGIPVAAQMTTEIEPGDILASALEAERKKCRASDSSQQEMTKTFTKERSGLEGQVEALQSKITSLENTIATKARLIEQLEKKLKEEQQMAKNAASKEGAEERKRISVLKEELGQSENKLKDISQKMDKVEKLCRTYEEKLSQLESESQKEKLKLDKQVAELEGSLKCVRGKRRSKELMAEKAGEGAIASAQTSSVIDGAAEKKRVDAMKAKHQKESKNRDQELTSLRAKLGSLESNSSISSKRVAELEDEYRAKMNKICEELSAEREAYENLTSKYEMLEEEHVLTKSQLVQEKESIQRELSSVRRDLSSARTEVETLIDSHSTKQAQWIKERADLQERQKQQQEKQARANNDNIISERNRLKAAVEEKNTMLDKVRHEMDVLADQMDHVRKENEELRRKLEDFDKVSKVHQSLKADAGALDKELKENKSRLMKEEKNHKAEIAQLKMRYDSRVAIISEEIQSLQGQVSRFKRERDTFRHMLEGAQEKIAELRSSPGTPRSNKSGRSDEVRASPRTSFPSADALVAASGATMAPSAACSTSVDQFALLSCNLL